MPRHYRHHHHHRQSSKSGGSSSSNRSNSSSDDSGASFAVTKGTVGGSSTAAPPTPKVGERSEVTLTDISSYLPPVLQLFRTAPAAPRRRLPKNLPLLQPPDADDSEFENYASTPGHVAVGDSSGILPAAFESLSAKVGGPSLPIVRAGATFLSTLHASVALSASLHPPSNPSSAPSSPYLTPTQRPNFFSPGPVFPVSVNMSSDATVGSTAAAPTNLPSLDFVPASNDDETTAALKLVADSIAQRRQLASYAVITHPYFLGIMGLAFAGVYRWLYKVPGDMLLVMTTCVGVLMAGLVSVRALVRPYIELAESINMAWLDSADGKPEVVVARWGDGDDRKVIGASVFNIEKSTGNGGGSNGGGSGGGSGGGRRGKKIATVRAWTTRQRERGKGVGKGLIEETVKLAQARGADSVRWQEANIYAERVLPGWANYGFEEGLKECRAKLEQYVDEYSKK